MSTTIIIAGVVGLVAGALITYVIQTIGLKKQAAAILSSAEKEAENIKKDKIVQAKEKFLELKEEHEKTINKRDRKLQDTEKRIKEKESQLQRQLEEVNRNKKHVDKQKENFDRKSEGLERRLEEIKGIRENHIKQLEVISGLSVDDAKKQLLDTLKDEIKSESAAYIQQATEEARMTAANEARKVVVQTIQRVGTEQAIENAVSVFNIENDDVKGRIIGREGRNIRAIEAATGVEVIVDDTPEAIILSCFDPVRREIARLALHRLVTDGRIHPARIEEVVNKVRKSIEEEIIETGKRTVIDLGIHGLHPELVKIVGRMKYRSSYGQNLLQHSREVANLSAIMATELGLNPKLAKRAGLLHDIGKVPTEETELPHALLGMKWAEKYGEKPDVCNAIGAHHDEIEMTSLLSPIIQVCDGISGARPGARRQVMESYVQRLKDLENLAMSYEGVTKAYAVQAGRELRIIVESERIDDKKAAEISYDVSQRIQNEMTYPGHIRVTVIRETRAVNVAR